MASNFFEQQDVARKKTGQLVVLFIVAVLAIFLLVYGAVVIFFVAGSSGEQAHAPGAPPPSPPYLEALVLTFIGVVAVIGGSSLYKISALRNGGGESVATMMGGRLLHAGSDDPTERKILNVVEEMALASGTPVPPVYLMDNEAGINAFAAGYAPESAVIGITRGAVEQLSRDELQGVVAHEFSHILNGDMRLNIRLMGVIFGIIGLSVIGRVLLRSAFFAGGGRGRKDNGGAMAILAFGIVLMAIGAVGVLFGRLIQAAVSRQREFLADASAVQFTRNPDTIGGALKRIGGGGSDIQDGHAGEISHMFIASAASSWAVGPFATHPPIEERIRRIDPSWDGRYPEPRQAPPKRTAKQRYTSGSRSGADIISGLPESILGTAILGGAADARRQGGSTSGPTPSAGGSAVDRAGTLSAEHVGYMQELLAAIPGVLRQAAREPFGARAVVYAVLLDRDREVRDNQLTHLARHADRPVYELTGRLVDASQSLPTEARLPLIDLSVPALREMSDAQYAAFKQNVDVLIKADGRVDLFEWTLERLLLRNLDAHFVPRPAPAVRYYNLKPVSAQCATVLSALAHIGQRDPEQARAAFEAGVKELGLAGLGMKDRSEVRLNEVGGALDALVHTSPREKKKLISACARAISADGEVTRGEGELMRAVSAVLGVPMPPLLPGQKLV